jgi:hypothetical protein
MDMDPMVKALEPGDRAWTFRDGSQRSAVNLRTAFIGLGRNLPGWRWSEHVGRESGKPSEPHVGYVISGRMCVRSAQGVEVLIDPGAAFEILPGHDAWVEGDEPCLALDFGSLD